MTMASAHESFDDLIVGVASPAAMLRGSPLDPGAPLGWVYPAGSQVIFRNEAAQPLPLEYSLVGYLVPVR